MTTFADLKTTLDSSVAVNQGDAKALQLATSAKAASDAEVAGDTLAFARAIQAAPGGFVVDAGSPTVTLYRSADGLSFTSVAIASFADPVPSPSPSPTTDPAPPQG